MYAGKIIRFVAVYVAAIQILSIKIVVLIFNFLSTQKLMIEV